MSSCGPQASASISPSGFRVRKVERKKPSPQTAIKNIEWNSGPLVSGCPLARTLLPSPTSPHPSSASQIQDVFLQWFFYFHRKTVPAAGVEQTPTATCTHTQWERFPLLATDATVLVLLRNLSNISIYTWILSNFNIFNNFCGHVNMAESMEDLKPILLKA